MEILLLDCNALQDRGSAHDYLQRVLRLPSYYGRNLDALADLLGEFGSHITVVLLNTACLPENSYGYRILEVFREFSASPRGFTLIEKE